MNALDFVMEVFSCAGGLAEGFRRAGIEIHLVIDRDPEACDSYAANLGRRPVQLDVNDLARLVELGWRPDRRVGLLVADPPCAPWSKAGKRRGIDDERDCLVVTCKLVSDLAPLTWMIANVPGLDEGPSWPIAQRLIGGLSAHGYCIDYVSLDAADYGVPQHRRRPFWFGHPVGTPCIRWPAATHGDPRKLHTLALPGVTGLSPWVTCRQALAHLLPKDLGRPIGMRRRRQNSLQHGSVMDKPARTVGTSNLSDDNVLLGEVGVATRQKPNKKHPPSPIDGPANTITANGSRHQCNALEFPADESRAQKLKRWRSKSLQSERIADADKPAPTVQARSDRLGSGMMIDFGEPAARAHGLPQSERVDPVDQPARTVRAKPEPIAVEWPWSRPSTAITGREVIGPPGHHDGWEGGLRSHPNAILLSERAGAALQGFPDGWKFHARSKKRRWEQIGQAVPPPMAEAIGRAIRGWAISAAGAECTRERPCSWCRDNTVAVIG